MKKILEYTAQMVGSKGYWAVTITRQSHHHEQFGVTNTEFSMGGNVYLSSQVEPENTSGRAIYVRGTDKTKDEIPMLMNADRFRDFKKIVAQYNAYEFDPPKWIPEPPPVSVDLVKWAVYHPKKRKYWSSWEDYKTLWSTDINSAVLLSSKKMAEECIRGEFDSDLKTCKIVKVIFSGTLTPVVD